MRFATFNKFVLLSLFMLLSFGMIQCDDENSVGGVQCLTSMDCDLNYSCQLGRCVSNPDAMLCNSNGDCPENYICVELDADQSKCIAEIETCTSDLECGIGYACQEGFCKPDENSTTCTSNEDCAEGYSCAEMTGGGYKCVPGNGGDTDTPVINDCGNACNEDGSCDSSNCFCCDRTCITKFPSCASDSDCYTGQVCLTSELVCTLEPSSCSKNGSSSDGDVEAEEAGPTCSGLFDTEVCGDKEVCCNGACKSYVHSCTAKEDCYKGQTCTNGVCDGTPESCTMNDPIQSTCTGDSDCPANQHCGGVEGGGIGCVDDCASDADCTDGASCNPNNGRCEYCTTQCPASQCCNYNIDFWYCGSCCEPACPLGQACNGGDFCVDMVCPDTCDDCYICGPETGYVCARDPDSCSAPETDGDTDVESRRNNQCLGSNEPCTAGVDECCSGTCLMGTCL